MTNEFTVEVPPQTCEDCLAPLLDYPGLAVDVAEFNIATPGSLSTDAEAIAAICEALQNWYLLHLPPGGGAALEADLDQVLALSWSDSIDAETANSHRTAVIECLDMLFGA